LSPSAKMREALFPFSQPRPQAGQVALQSTLTEPKLPVRDLLAEGQPRLPVGIHQRGVVARRSGTCSGVSSTSRVPADVSTAAVGYAGAAEHFRDLGRTLFEQLSEWSRSPTQERTSVLAPQIEKRSQAFKSPRLRQSVGKVGARAPMRHGVTRPPWRWNPLRVLSSVQPTAALSSEPG
jgi:hypothetical protein